MEIFELRYFLGVAQEQNIHRASERLRVSPASLSKAISRLEDELGTKLFSREGRNIRITDHGMLLQLRASEIVQLEESSRLEIAGHEGSIRIVIAGSEVLLSKFGLAFSESAKKKFPLATFEYSSADDADAIGAVERGEAHVALTSGDVPAGFSAKIIGESTFQTCVGPGHKLYAAARAKKVLAVEEVLKFAFASPNYSLLGQVGLKQSLDGWRDDKFPRKVEFKTSSLKLLEELVASGRALAYLPDYFVDARKIAVMKISGCPYSCSQKIRLVARNPKQVGWLNQLF